MVNSKDIDLMIHLAQKPEKATPMDWEWLNDLREIHPDFDFLLKAYVSVSEQLGIKNEAVSKAQISWKSKAPFFKNPFIEKKERVLSEIDKCSTSQRIRLFLANFQTQHAPFHLEDLE